MLPNPSSRLCRSNETSSPDAYTGHVTAGEHLNFDVMLRFLQAPFRWQRSVLRHSRVHGDRWKGGRPIRSPYIAAPYIGDKSVDCMQTSRVNDLVLPIAYRVN